MASPVAKAVHVIIHVETGTGASSGSLGPIGINLVRKEPWRQLMVVLITDENQFLFIITVLIQSCVLVVCMFI